MSVFEQAYAGGYDALYRDKDYGAECDAVEAAFALFGAAAPKRLLDIGCGTGGHAIEFARRGHRVTGVDAAPAMLRLARQKSEAAGVAAATEYLDGDARDFRAPQAPFDAAVMMFAVLGYLNGNDDIAAALANARAHLKPGGVFVCDFWWGPAVLSERPGERVRIVDGAAGRLLRATRTDLDVVTNSADVHFDLFAFAADAPAVQSSETHRMRYFFGPELHLFCKSAGLRIERLGQFPDFELAPTASSWNAMLVARAV